MADYPRELDTAQQIRRLQEQIRRLQTRSPVDGSVEPFQSLAPYFGAGWTDYDQDASFYKDRERVYLRGSLIFNANAVGANNQVLISSLPVGYRPTTINVFFAIFTDNNATTPATAKSWWSAVVNSTRAGAIELQKNPEFIASPNLGGCPDGTVLDLAPLSFRIN